MVADDIEAQIVGEWVEEAERKIADDLREALAAYAHEAWSGWLRYLFSRCSSNAGLYIDCGGQTAIIPAWAVKRWARQMETSYVDLPEKEKESDRKEADKMLAIMGRKTTALDGHGDCLKSPDGKHLGSAGGTCQHCGALHPDTITIPKKDNEQ